MAQKSALGKGLASLLPGAGKPGKTPIPPPAPPEAQEAAKKVEEKKKAQQQEQSPVGAESAGKPTTTFQTAAALTPSQSVESNAQSIPGITFALLSEIQVNPYQPRREFDEAQIGELADSIKANGVIQPLVVRKTSEGMQLIAGERRLRAAKIAGLHQIPVVVRRTTDRESLELAIVENVQRQDLNCVDEALAYFQLTQEFSLTQEEIAKRVGKSRATIANFLRLLQLPEQIRGDLKKEKLSFGHAKVLLGLEESEQQLDVYKEVMEGDLSVRETEALVQEIKEPAADETPSSAKPSAKKASVSVKGISEQLRNRLNHLSQELTHKFSARVEVKGTDSKGKILIHYQSREDLERILASMQEK